jgi:hypothetical protein
VRTVHVNTVPHDGQRYDTAGDWYTLPAFAHVPAHDVVTVSDMGDPDSEFLVALHELFEMHLCKRDGVTAQQVDEWDMGKGSGLDEPGAHPAAPYACQHELASCLERAAADLLGVDWDEHCARVDSLGGER